MATSTDPDSDNPSTAASISAAENNDDVFPPENEIKAPLQLQHHDDGYHTEGKNVKINSHLNISIVLFRS